VKVSDRSENKMRRFLVLARCFPAHQPLNKSTNQQINKSTNQQINPSTNQPLNKSTNPQSTPQQIN